MIHIIEEEKTTINTVTNIEIKNPKKIDDIADNKEKVESVFTMFTEINKPVICSVCKNEITKKFLVLGEKFNQDLKYKVFGEIYSPVCLPCTKKILKVD